MALIIIHHEGVFNIHSTVADAPFYDSGLTEAHLYEHFQWHDPTSMLPKNKFALDDRIALAKEQGSSSRVCPSLRDTIICNRAGEYGTNLSYEEYVKKFLTIKE